MSDIDRTAHLAKKLALLSLSLWVLTVLALVLGIRFVRPRFGELRVQRITLVDDAGKPVGALVGSERSATLELGEGSSAARWLASPIITSLTLGNRDQGAHIEQVVGGKVVYMVVSDDRGRNLWLRPEK